MNTIYLFWGAGAIFLCGLAFSGQSDFEVSYDTRLTCLCTCVVSALTLVAVALAIKYGKP